MSEEETDEDDEMAISVEYSPMELVAGLQLLDYMDLMFLEEGMPMGIVGVHRQKMLEALLKEDIHDELETEKESRKEKFEEMFGDRIPENMDKKSGFQ